MTCGMCEVPAPTAAECTDSTSWYWKKAKYDCDYVAKDAEERCSLKDDAKVKSEDACPMTCGACEVPAPTAAECADSTSWYWKKAKYDCDYVAKDAEERCSLKDDAKVKSEDACPMTCGACDGDLPAPAPTGEACSCECDVPAPAPTKKPTLEPTAPSLEITAVGTLSTCVSGVECTVAWDYRGGSSVCRTLDLAVADKDGNVVVSGTADNDGAITSVVSGDAEVSEYTMTLACADDPAVAASYDFQVSYTLAPTREPTREPTRKPTRKPTLEPTREPTREPTVTPTASFLQITSIGTGSTCVHDVECEVLWIYSGDSSSWPWPCMTLDVVVADLDGTVVGTTTATNDGQQMQTKVPTT